MVNGWEKLGCLLHKQKIGENGMVIQEDWRQQLKVNHHVHKELVDKISWELMINGMHVWRENDRVAFGATFVPALYQLDLQILKTCSVYTYKLAFGSKCIWYISSVLSDLIHRYWGLRLPRAPVLKCILIQFLVNFFMACHIIFGNSFCLERDQS